MRRAVSVSVALALLMGLPVASPPLRAEGAAPARPSAPIDAAVLAQYEHKDDGRYLVVLGDRADLREASSVPDRSQRKRAVHAALVAHTERSQRDVRAQLERGRAAGMVSSFRPFWLANLVSVRSDESMLRFIAARPGVTRILADAPVVPVQPVAPLVAAGSDPYEPGWNIERVGARAAWEAGTDGRGTVVANIDSGVDHTHPLLRAAYRGSDGNHDYDWWDDTADTAAPIDTDGHGTLVMGTMVGGDGAGPGSPDLGVAPGARWIAARIFGNNDSVTTTTRALSALEWVTAPTRLDGTDPRPDLAPDVVNNSWGYPGSDCTAFDPVHEAWRAAGIVGIWAAGNNGPAPGSVLTQAASPLAYAVGATDASDEVAHFSSRGPSCLGEVKPEIAAPGVGVTSTYLGGGIDIASGTSLAAPQVAGAAALVLDASVGQLGVDEVEAVLAATAVDLEPAGMDNDSGAGRLDAARAVQESLRGGAVEGRVTGTDGPGVPGATVVVTAGSVQRQATTRDDGTYRLRAPSGAHPVRAEAFGFRPVDTAVTVADGATTRLDVVLDALPRATISGVVREHPDGAAVAGAAVRLRDAPLAPTVSGPDGSYRLDVPVGSYVLDVQGDRCHEPASTAVTVSDDVTVDVTVDIRVDGFGHGCEVVPFLDEPGSELLSLFGDEESADLALPFPVPFYGRTYTSVQVHTNGFISFTPSHPAHVDVPIPDPDYPNAAVYALWDDLVVPSDPGAGVFTGVHGTAPRRRFVVEYRAVTRYVGTGQASFAVVLGEDGTVELRWGALDELHRGGEATVGIEDERGVSALQLLHEEPVLQERSAVRFRPAPVGHVAGTVRRAGDGRPLPDVLVSASRVATRTAPDGTYRLALLPGDHKLTVTAPFDGFDPARADVQIVRATTTVVDLVLDGPAAEITGGPLSIEAACEPVTRRAASVTSAGTRPLLMAAFAFGEPRTLVDDPVGDSRAHVDLTTVAAQVFRRRASLAISFAPGQSPGSLDATALLDTDQNPGTGIQVPRHGIGADYTVDLRFAPLFFGVPVFDARGEFVTEFRADFDGDTVYVDVDGRPLGDDGTFDLAVVAPAPQPRPWDSAPDTSSVEVGPGQDYRWLSAAPDFSFLDPGMTEHVTVTADPRGVPAGTYHAQIGIYTTDPLNPGTEIPLTVVIRPSTTTPTGRCIERPR